MLHKQQNRHYVEGDSITFNSILALYEKIVGRDATPDEVDQMKDAWNEGCANYYDSVGDLGPSANKKPLRS